MKASPLGIAEESLAKPILVEQKVAKEAKESIWINRAFGAGLCSYIGFLVAALYERRSLAPFSSEYQRGKFSLLLYPRSQTAVTMCT